MHGVTKFSALAVAAVAAVVVLVVALAWLGPAGDGIAPSASAALFDEELVQEIHSRVSPAVVVVRADRQSGDSFTPVATGSGFLVDRDGHIVTNNHVIRAADRVLVEFENGRFAEAELLGTSPGNDLALLKVHPALVEHIEPVRLGDSSRVRPGQMAVAIGSPFGLGRSVTVGVVGGVNRILGSDVARSVHGILQTDTVTNAGDSGGPLLDRAGRVVGINTYVQLGSGELDGRNASRRIGFALPVNTLARLLPRLKEEQVIWPTFLGIAAAPIDALLAERLGLPRRTGVYVTRVLSDSPAHGAGLVPAQARSRGLPEGGDVIAAVDGVPVALTAAFFAEIDRHLPGDEVTLSVVRKGVEIEVMVTLAGWPAGGNPFLNSPDVDPSGLKGSAPPHYPFVPRIPGFSFPDLFPG